MFKKNKKNKLTYAVAYNYVCNMYEIISSEAYAKNPDWYSLYSQWTDDYNIAIDALEQARILNPKLQKDKE